MQVENSATLPGLRSPSTTSVARPFFFAARRKRLLASGGSHASGWTSSAACSTLRIGFVRFAAFTAWTTIGMPASWPCTSVEASSFAPAPTSPLPKRIALARSIRCGKSTFHGCGGTYGHLVM